MLVGSLVVSRITGFAATWFALFVLLSLHLSLNYAAVRSVQMNTLNRQRANIVFSHLLPSDPGFADLVYDEEPKQEQKQMPASISMLSPAQVAKQERIFETGGALSLYSSSQTPQVLGTCQIGVSLHDFLSQSCTALSGSNSLLTSLPLEEIASLFNDEEYILFLTPTSATSHKIKHIQASILLKPSSPSRATSTSTPKPKPKANPHLKAWVHALLAAKSMREHYNSNEITSWTPDDTLQILTRTLTYLNHAGRFETYISSLQTKGWDVGLEGQSALETRIGKRVGVLVS